MTRILSITAAAAIVFLLLGCTLEPTSPADLSGNYFVQSPETDDDTYYVIQILTKTTGEIYTYTDVGSDDDSSNDTFTTDSFTITVDFPWVFDGGPLSSNDAINIGRSSIRIPNFDGEALSYFPAYGTSYP